MLGRLLSGSVTLAEEQSEQVPQQIMGLSPFRMSLTYRQGATERDCRLSVFRGDILSARKAVYPSACRNNRRPRPCSRCSHSTEASRLTSSTLPPTNSLEFSRTTRSPGDNRVQSETAAAHGRATRRIPGGPKDFDRLILCSLVMAPCRWWPVRRSRGGFRGSLAARASTFFCRILSVRDKFVVPAGPCRMDQHRRMVVVSVVGRKVR